MGLQALRCVIEHGADPSLNRLGGCVKGGGGGAGDGSSAEVSRLVISQSRSPQFWCAKLERIFVITGLGEQISAPTGIELGFQVFAFNWNFLLFVFMVPLFVPPISGFVRLNDCFRHKELFDAFVMAVSFGQKRRIRP